MNEFQSKYAKFKSLRKTVIACIFGLIIPIALCNQNQIIYLTGLCLELILIIIKICIDYKIEKLVDDYYYEKYGEHIK